MRRAPAGSLLLVALLAAACGASVTPGGSDAVGTNSLAPSSAASAAPTSSEAGNSASPASGAPSASAEPSGTPGASAPESETPSASDRASPSGTASLSPSPSAASLACEPEGNNPSFWPGIASAVSWDVYCAVLPKGWHVESGSYRLAKGGYLIISYKGPNGASLTLSEGSFCADGSDCVPSGPETGDAAFGALPATLVSTDAGGFAIVASRGQQPSWLMVTSGLDQATATAFGAALAPVH